MTTEPRCNFLVVGRRGETCGQPAEWIHHEPGWPASYRCVEHQPPQHQVHRTAWRRIEATA